jgi:hypothetical protein
MLSHTDKLVNVLAIAIGLYYVGIGIKKNSNIYKSIGLLWIAVDTMMITNPKLSKDITCNNNYIFAIMYMVLPAFIMVPLIYDESYKLNDWIGRTIAFAIFFVDTLHFFQYFKITKYYIIFILFLLTLLFLMRQTNDVHYDDLHPEIETNMNYLDKSDIIFVIPKYKNKKITDYPDWCKQIKNYSEKHKKTLALHGIKHTTINGYKGDCEFVRKIPEKELKEACEIFEKAFGYKPKHFKAPCYGLSKENQKLVEKLNMKIYGPSTLIFNKLYHSPMNENMKMINKFIDFY